MSTWIDIICMMLSLACSLHQPDKLPREQQNNEYIPNASRKWWICWTVKHNEITIKYTVTLDLEHRCSPRFKHQYAVRCVTVPNAFDALKINSKWNLIQMKKTLTLCSNHSHMANGHDTGHHSHWVLFNESKLQWICRQVYQ